MGGRNGRQCKRIAEALVLALFLGCTIWAGRDRPQRFIPAGAREKTDSRYAWMERLIPESESREYVFADIALTGEAADISWHIFFDQSSLLDALSLQGRKKPPAADGTICWRFVKMKLGEDDHASDIRDWLAENLQEEGYLFQAETDGEGERFALSQVWEPVLEEQGMIWSKRLLVFRAGYLYGLSSLWVNDQNREETAAQMMHFQYDCAMKTDSSCFGGWIMDEEVLYWTDHQSRETSLESPRRRFTELRAQDVNWPDRWMGRFGLLTEAEYEVALEPGKGEFLISFRFAQEIPEEGYSDYLLNGFCMDEVYQMEVKNSLGEPVQEQELKLCMEKTDTILFEDLDGDGCTDMKILYPRHEFEGLEDYGYWLWNRREQRFERIRESELFAPGRETEAEKGPETIAVQPGDSLWKLAEEHYGDGFRYMEIYEKNRAVIGPDPSMIRAGAVLELP